MPTVDFSGVAAATKNPFVFFKGNTAHFQGETFLDGSLGPVIVPDTSFVGTVSWTFDNLASQVEFDAFYLDAQGTLQVTFLDADGNVLSTQTNSLANEHFFFQSQQGIAEVVVTSTNDQYALDTMSFQTMFEEVGPTGNRDIDGLLWGWKWGDKTITYSFPDNASEYFSSGYVDVSNFQPLSGKQKAAYERIIDNFDGVCGLKFVKTNQVFADVRFGEADSIDYGDALGSHLPGNNTAEGNPPSPDIAASSWGDVWLTHGTYDRPAYGSFAYAAGLMHELGHSMGLKHGHISQQGHGTTFPALARDHNSFNYSIMTYTQYPGDKMPVDTAVDHPTTLMQNDIATLQHLYGADYGYRDGDTTYRFDSKGQLLVDGKGQGVPLHQKALLTIWDGGGIDTYDFSNRRNDVVIDLGEGKWSTFGPRANLGEGHLARGNVANALLYKGNEASLIEKAIGGSGDDRIVGNGVDNVLIGRGGGDSLYGRDGSDRLIGGSGRDRFVFNTALSGDNIDAIADFESDQDRIYLEGSIFKGLGNGVVSQQEFRQHFDVSNGKAVLSFDGETFVEFERRVDLSARDFFVI